MTKNLRLINLFVLLATASFGAELPSVILRNVEITRPQAPVYQSEDGEDTVQIKGMPAIPEGKEKWFRISAEFETNPEWYDRLRLEYYVLLPAENGSNVLFKGVAEYVDIPAGRGHQSDMYLHPYAVRRYYKKGNIEYAVVVLAGDKEVSVKTSKRSPDKWWKTQTPSGVLLGRQNTPFRIINENLCRDMKSSD